MKQRHGDPICAAVEWSDLVDELDRWHAAGRVAGLWWRDDDARLPSAQLDRLLVLAGDVPIALAVVPQGAVPGLAAALASVPGAAVLQHGWQHVNHAGIGKKSGFPAARQRAIVAAELTAGRARLRALFGARALAVLAPPWNRLDDRFLPVLAGPGIGALSRQGARRAAAPAPGLVEANVHVDLVAWKGDRGFIGAGPALAGLVRHMRARRGGIVDAAEPTGILTHHLVQDAQAEAFLSRLLAVVAAHPAARWLHAREVFAAA